MEMKSWKRRLDCLKHTRENPLQHVEQMIPAPFANQMFLIGDSQLIFQINYLKNETLGEWFENK